MAVVAISTDEPEDSVRFAAELGFTFPMLYDGDLAVAQAYGVASKHEEVAIPSIFIVEPNYRIAWHDVGDTIADRVPVSALLERVDSALARSEGRVPPDAADDGGKRS